MFFVYATESPIDLLRIGNIMKGLSFLMVLGVVAIVINYACGETGNTNHRVCKSLWYYKNEFISRPFL